MDVDHGKDGIHGNGLIRYSGHGPSNAEQNFLAERRQPSGFATVARLSGVIGRTGS